MSEQSMKALLAAHKESGDFYNPAPGAYTFKIVGANATSKPLSAGMFLEVQGGPDAGQKWLTTFGSLEGKGAGMAMKQWEIAGVTPAWIESLATDDYATIVKAVRVALLGVVIECMVAPQGGTGQYADRPNIQFNSLKLVSRPELPSTATALAGQAVPSAPPTALPTAAPATAPATVPAAVPAASAVPAAAPAGPAVAEVDPQVAALQAQLAALQAQQAATPNGVPAVAPAIAEEDPGF